MRNGGGFSDINISFCLPDSDCDDWINRILSSGCEFSDKHWEDSIYILRMQSFCVMWFRAWLESTLMIENQIKYHGLMRVQLSSVFIWLLGVTCAVV
jgi:hypothetical protein